MAHVFGDRSERNLITCHPDLQEIMRQALRISPIDFSIIFGHRPMEEQFDLYKQGRSYKNGKWVITDKTKVVTNIDGYRIQGKHNLDPSEAVDIMIYTPSHDDLAWDPEHLSHVAGVVIAVADRLLQEGRIAHRIRWGGNWDGDGIILRDQRLMDRPHFEIITDDQDIFHA